MNHTTTAAELVVPPARRKHNIVLQCEHFRGWRNMGESGSTQAAPPPPQRCATIFRAKLKCHEDKLVSLLTILAVGFVLGMRHATDADHVIAVSTIVTREHKASRAALIGAAWGLGHTVTIFAVGSILILFRITLPP